MNVLPKLADFNAMNAVESSYHLGVEGTGPTSNRGESSGVGYDCICEHQGGGGGEGGAGGQCWSSEEENQ